MTNLEKKYLKLLEDPYVAALIIEAVVYTCNVFGGDLSMLVEQEEDYESDDPMIGLINKAKVILKELDLSIYIAGETIDITKLLTKKV